MFKLSICPPIEEKICNELEEGEAECFVDQEIRFNDLYDSIESIDKDLIEFGDEIYSSPNGRIYKHPYKQNKLIKQSFIIEQTKIMIERSRHYYCRDIVSAIKYTINENINNEKFSELGGIFPMHFINVSNIGQHIIDGIGQNIYEMEFVDGIQLDKFICGKLTIDAQLLQIIKQIVYVGVYMNSKGYFHNDLKLDNLMIVKNPNNKIVYNQLTTEFELVDSPYYFKLIDYSTGVILGDSIDPADSIHLIDPIVILSEIKRYINPKKFIQTNALITEIFDYLNINVLGQMYLLDENQIMKKSIKLPIDKIREFVNILKN